MTPGNIFNQWHPGFGSILTLHKEWLSDMIYTASQRTHSNNLLIHLLWTGFLSIPASLPHSLTDASWVTSQLNYFHVLFSILRVWKIHLRQIHFPNKFQGVIFLISKLCLVSVQNIIKFSQVMTSKAWSGKTFLDSSTAGPGDKKVKGPRHCLHQDYSLSL